MKAYNTSVHEGTEFTPHELVFGRTARVPASNQLTDDNDDESYPEYATAFFKRIFDARASARENLKQAKIRSKRYYDRRTNPQAFKQNDYVSLLKEPSKSKFDEQYIGPFQILETLDNNNVRLEISDKRTKIVHGDKIRICKARPPFLKMPFTPTPYDIYSHLFRGDQAATDGLWKASHTQVVRSI
ncbi:hypothetical protein HN011_003832 [Eciton burchellii]|nr:hypothetical protein HN011_003832 [Eciton burchellii]